jgi:hypothetical protein
MKEEKSKLMNRTPSPSFDTENSARPIDSWSINNSPFTDGKVDQDDYSRANEEECNPIEDIAGDGRIINEAEQLTADTKLLSTRYVHINGETKKRCLMN